MSDVGKFLESQKDWDWSLKSVDKNESVGACYPLTWLGVEAEDGFVAVSVGLLMRSPFLMKLIEYKHWEDSDSDFLRVNGVTVLHIPNAMGPLRPWCFFTVPKTL